MQGALEAASASIGLSAKQDLWFCVMGSFASAGRQGNAIEPLPTARHAEQLGEI